MTAIAAGQIAQTALEGVNTASKGLPECSSRPAKVFLFLERKRKRSKKKRNFTLYPYS